MLIKLVGIIIGGDLGVGKSKIVLRPVRQQTVENGLYYLLSRVVQRTLRKTTNELGMSFTINTIAHRWEDLTHKDYDKGQPTI
jgi:hypothetical protein